MGGKVTVESEEGVGTSFILNLKTKCKVHKQHKNPDQSNLPQEFIKSTEKGDILVLESPYDLAEKATVLQESASTVNVEYLKQSKLQRRCMKKAMNLNRPENS